MSILADFHFIRPQGLLLVIPVLLLLTLTWRRRGQARGWQAVIDPALLPHLLQSSGSGKQFNPLVFVGIGSLISVIAVAGPSWEKIPQPVQRTQDALVILYDLSPSMLAEDIKPSRLVRSRQKLLDLLMQREEGTTALIAFAGDEHVVSPLTDDRRTIANLLPALSPVMMPVQGSRPELALERGIRLLRDAGHSRGTLLLITDGVSARQSTMMTQMLSQIPFTLSIIGVGSTEGAPIPGPDGFVKDRRGNIVLAGLKRAPLQKLAGQTGGTYHDLSLDEGDLKRVLNPPPLTSRAALLSQDRSVDRWEDFGYWLLPLLVPVVLMSFRRGWLLALTALFIQPTDVQALEWQDLWSTPDQQAAELLAADDAEGAAQRFQNPRWRAAANYRAGDFEAAEQLYANQDDAQSWYNRANSLAKAGDLETAIKAYEEALQRAPKHEDATFNKKLVENLLQQQQEQQEQQDQQQNQENGDEEQGGSQNQQGQDQQQSDKSGESDHHKKQQQDDQQSQQSGDPSKTDDSSQSDTEQTQQEQNNEAEKGEENETMEAAMEAASQSEKDMANEQWLRRLSDDPAGLLRRKFQYESQQRINQGDPGEEQNW